LDGYMNLLEDAIEQYITHLKTIKNASPHTVRNYAIDLNALKTYFNDKNITFLNQIDRKGIRSFLYSLGEVQNKKTLSRRISAIRSFFKYLYEYRRVEVNPAELIETPKLDKPIPNSLSYLEVQQLFDAPETSTFFGLRDRAIMELLYSSGLRISELVGLNRQDIDSTSFLIKVRGKGKKERLIPITPTALQWITKYVNHKERYIEMDGHYEEKDPQAVFLNKWGKRLTSRSIDRHFAAYLKKTGLAGRATPPIPSGIPLLPIGWKTEWI